jgi:NAD(P)-dependent dehydrogenase (short-subunit alcohol dehydrogenase family)
LAAASADYHIILTGRSLEKVEVALTEIQASNPAGSLSALQLDVTDQASVDQAVAYVTSTFGKLDVLINNAALGSKEPDVRKRFHESMEVNVIGPAVVAANFRPLLMKSKKPYSLFVSSGIGSMTRASDPSLPYYKGGPPNGNSYRVSKAALNMLALQEWIENEDKGLKVFAMCPEFVRSHLRGKGEMEISGGGGAGDPKVSGKIMLSIVKGERDADVGKFVWKDGVYPW